MRTENVEILHDWEANLNRQIPLDFASARDAAGTVGHQLVKNETRAESRANIKLLKFIDADRRHQLPAGARCH